MNTHRYVSHIDPQTWNDLTTIRNETKTSYNQLIKEGCRLITKQRFESISKQKKQRNSMSGWTI